MNVNNNTPTNKRQLDHEQRLRAAMKILVDYLLQHGRLAPNQPLTAIATEHKQEESADMLSTSNQVEQQ